MSVPSTSVHGGGSAHPVSGALSREPLPPGACIEHATCLRTASSSGGGGLGLAGEGLQMPGQEAVPTYNKYRPPPGFAQDEEDKAEKWTGLDKQLKQMDSNQLLEMLNCKGGYWHTLAKVCPAVPTRPLKRPATTQHAPHLLLQR